jgi:tRNA pseudouridine65 synthase
LIAIIKELEIIYRDEYLVAVNKHHDLLVHRTRISDEKNLFALQMLRDQIGQHVFPAHRLDRKTSGVLLFALNQNIHRQMQLKFSSGEIKKKYLAIVRGYSAETGIIDYPVKKENGKLAEALTRYKTIEQVEIDIPSGNHQTSRYSLVEVIPETGRMHQIRKHFAHINHPIIGDRPHGCHIQNRLFKNKWDISTMMLHADELSFIHPVTDKEIKIKAILHNEFRETIRILGFDTQHYQLDSKTL